MNTLQSHAKATLLTANSLLPLAPFHIDLGREKMCCGSPLPEHHSPEPEEPPRSLLWCHAMAFPLQIFAEFHMDLEARKKLWVIFISISPLAELPWSSDTCGHQARPEELLHRPGNKCNEIQVAGRHVHKES